MNPDAQRDPVSPAADLPRHVRARARLLLVRHGATAPNLAGLRCGGDVDPPLADEGRRQAIRLARQLADRQERLDLIISADLARTRETAAILRAALGPVEMRLMPGFRERRLGGWNLKPIADTEPGLAAGEPPPGGESRQAFAERIETALLQIAPTLCGRVLLVASKGVGRVLRERAGLPAGAPMANAEMLELSFELPCTNEPMVS